MDGMTAVQGSVRGEHRVHGTVTDHLIKPLDHSPEVLLALAAVLIVVAGPVLRTFGPTGAVTSGVSVLLLGAGVVLAVAAASRLLRN